MSPPVLQPAVHTEDLRKSYGLIEALRGLSLSVARGEIFGILGPNGAGKTTLIRSLVGSTRPTGGTVTVLGLDPVRQARALRRRIGYMPQAPALYEDLPARDNIRFFAAAHGLPDLDARLDAILDFTALRARQSDPVHTFSGGMKQRVSMACALVHEPELLFLDEPTAGVDPALRETFWGHFRSLAARGVTLLISTHQMDEALYCDRLAVLREGVLLACDTPKNLLARGRTTVRVWRGEQAETETLTGAADALPRLLQKHGLDPAVRRIEVEEEPLEKIVLDLIAEAGARVETPPPAGGGTAA